jgi:hypothetical protein
MLFHRRHNRKTLALARLLADLNALSCVRQRYVFK